MGLFGKKKPKKEVPPIFTFALSTNTIPPDDTLLDKLQPIIDTDPEVIIVSASLNFNLVEVVKRFTKIFPKTQIVGVKPRGIIATESAFIPKQGIGVLALSKDVFRASVWFPTNSKEHKIEYGIPVAIKKFIKYHTKYTTTFKTAFNLLIGDSYQNGHLLIDTYEKELNSEGIYNIPLTGAILHPEIPQKQDFLVFAFKNNIEIIKNGFIFISIFTKYNVENKIASGLYPRIPFKITEAHDSIVLKLNQRPAFITYKEYISKKGLSEDTITKNLPLIFATYQFGFPNPRSPKHPEIRIAIKRTEEDALKFNGEIAKGSTIWIMEADTNRMIEHTRSLIENNNEKVVGGIIFSSIFRLIRMKNDYLKDLENIKQIMGNRPFLMFNTYLEIFYKNAKEAYTNSSTNLINIFNR